MADPKYTFGIPGAATDAARRNALGQTAGGMIRVPAQQWLAKALRPELLTRQGEAYEISYHAIEFILNPAITRFGEGIDNLAWYMKFTRLSSLLKDLCETGGLSFTTTGLSMEAARSAVEKAAKDLTVQMRTLTAAQIHQYDSPTTGSFVDSLSAARLIGSDGSLITLWQARQLLPGIWSNQQWGSDLLSGAIATMVPDGSVSRPPREQVAGVVQMLLQTTVRNQDLLSYIHPDKVEDEIQRRKSGDKVDPLVAAAWSTAYPPLRKIFAPVTPGFEVVRALKEGISALDLGSADITLQQITTFCSKIAPSLATLEDDPADVAGNRARLERAITSAKALTAAARGAQGGKETIATTTDTESQFMEVSRDDSFISLEKEIASLASGPLNLDGQKKIVKTLLASKCAAGPLFLMRKLSAMDSQHPFSLVRQLKVGDGKGTGGMIIQQLCNDALSTKDGTARHWGELISAADATKFIKGNLECVKSASGFDFWELLAPSISKRDGILAVANASTGKTGDSRWIFLNARPLELMLTPLWDLFKLLGYSKTTAGGFHGTFKNIISRTKVIGDLPPEDPRTEGVKELHVDACTEIFLCFANEYRAILDLQLSVAVANGRPSTFYNANSTAGQLWAKVGKHIDDIQEQAALEEQGLSKRPHSGDQADGGQTKWQANDSWQGGQRQQWRQQRPWQELGQSDAPEVATALCNECGEEADNGAIDPSDGMYYCATCWDAYSLLQAHSAANANAAHANAARNQRDVATLRKIFPGHCAYHLYYHHVRGRTGCMRANCKLQHERPDDLDAALTRLEGPGRA